MKEMYMRMKDAFREVYGPPEIGTEIKIKR